MSNFSGPPYALYSVLGVGSTASSQVVKKAYQQLALQFHPDKNGGDDAVFKEIQAAYDVLSDDVRKKEYDDYCALEIAKQTQADISQQERERKSPIYKTKSKAGIGEKISEWLRKNLYGKFQDVWSEPMAKKLDDDIDKVVSKTAEFLNKHPFGGIEKRLRAAERVARYEKISLASCQRAVADYQECLPTTDISFWEEKIKALGVARKVKNKEKPDPKTKELVLQEESTELQNLYQHIVESWRKDFEKILLQWMLTQIELAKQQLYAKYFGLLSNLRQMKSVLGAIPGFGWDLSLGNLTPQEVQVILKWGEFFRNNPELQKLCELLGKMNKEASKAEKIKIMETVQYENIVIDYNSKEEIRGITFSDKIEDALPQELGLLVDDDMSLLFDLKFVERRLMSFEKMGYASEKVSKVEEKEKTVEKKEKKGPVIVCVDTSGSMSGDPENIAKALTLCLASMAHKQDRQCFLINFSTDIETFDFSKDKGLSELLKFLQMGFHGGTDVFPALWKGLEMMKDEAYQKADLLVVSDFEFSYENEELLNAMNEQRKKGNHFFGLSIMENYGYRYSYRGDDACEKLFDEMWKCSPSNYDVRRLYSFIEGVAKEKQA